MSTNIHADLTGLEIHIPYRQVFANEAARLGDTTVYATEDLYKKAFQIDTQVEYVLTGVLPTVWTAIGGGGGGGGSPSGPASGDLSQTYPSPWVVAVHSGTTQLTVGSISDGQLLSRSGTSIVGYTLSTATTIKNPVKAATVYHLPAFTKQPDGVTMIADANGAFPTIDGIIISVGDRILVRAEQIYSYADWVTGGGSVSPTDLGDPKYNGIYELTVQGDGGTPWEMERTSDADTSADLEAGNVVYVAQGYRYRDAGFRITADPSGVPIVMNTDDIYFSEISKPWHYTSIVATDGSYIETVLAAWDTLFIHVFDSGAAYTTDINLLLPVSDVWSRGMQVKIKLDLSEFLDQAHVPDDIITFNVECVDGTCTIDGDTSFTTSLVDQMVLVFEADGAGGYMQVG